MFHSLLYVINNKYNLWYLTDNWNPVLYLAILIFYIIISPFDLRRYDKQRRPFCLRDSPSWRREPGEVASPHQTAYLSIVWL